MRILPFFLLGVACGGNDPAPAAARVEVTPATLTLAPAELERLTARVTDEDGAPWSGATVVWSSSDPAVAAVASGVVTAGAAGTATVTATVPGTAVSGSAAVTVRDGPAARWGHGLVYDDARHQVVLFGGSNGAGFLDDTWLWDGSAWRRVEVAGPTARDQHVMVYDAARARVVLFGGRLLTDTWEWDGARWEMKARSGPPAREHHGAGWDATRSQVIVFGGNGTNGTALADTWGWDGATWTRRSTSVPPGDHMLPSRGAVFSTPRGALLSMIGDLAAGASDLWAWDGAAWSAIAGGRLGAGAPVLLAATGVAGELLAIDELPGGAVSVHTWRWDGAAWTRVAMTGPPARFVGGMVHDAARGEVVLFGGAGPENPSIGRYRGDTWVWNGTAWAMK